MSLYICRHIDKKMWLIIDICTCMIHIMPIDMSKKTNMVNGIGIERKSAKSIAIITFSASVLCTDTLIL